MMKLKCPKWIKVKLCRHRYISKDKIARIIITSETLELGEIKRIKIGDYLGIIKECEKCGYEGLIILKEFENTDQYESTVLFA